MDKSGNSSQPKATRASKLAESLKGAILTGALRPGQKLSLDRLREAQGVSLSPLREAFSRLVSTGLVEMEDQRGYRVAPVSSENLREILALRIVLDSRALSESIRNGDLDWESAVLGSCHRLTRAQDATALTEARREFHIALIDRCRMPMLTALCGRHFDLFTRYMNLFAPGLSGPAPDQDAHVAIAEAAVARDAPTAILLLTRHIEGCGQAIAAGMAASSPAVEPTESAR